jgi:hypothetical protein
MTQEQVSVYVSKELEKTHKNHFVISGDGYVYAQGDFPVLLVAHMDTVHAKLPTVINYDTKTESLSSPNGIGGDDRCGIYMVLEIVKQYNCSVLFTEDEETGCVGAEKFIKTELASELEFNYIIEFDRRGDKDAVFYNCDNDEFEKFITKEFFKTSWGSYTDISKLAPFFGCAAVNLSCGYHKAHTKDEYVVVPQMKKVIEEACKILERTTEDDKFEYIEAKYAYYDYDYDYYGGYYTNGYSYNYNRSKYWLLEYQDENHKVQYFDIEAVSKAEAIGKLLMLQPNTCYNDVIDVIMVDGRLY